MVGLAPDVGAGPRLDCAVGFAPAGAEFGSTVAVVVAAAAAAKSPSIPAVGSSSSVLGSNSGARKTAAELRSGFAFAAPVGLAVVQPVEAHNNRVFEFLEIKSHGIEVSWSIKFERSV